MGLFISSVASLVILILLGIAAQLTSAYDRGLWPAIHRAKRLAREIVRKWDPDAQVFTRQGATRIDPRHFAICIRTKTDLKRDQFCWDSTLQAELRDALLRSGYPPASVPFVHLCIQSQETVDRDFGGSWAEASEMPRISDAKDEGRDPVIR